MVCFIHRRGCEGVTSRWVGFAELGLRFDNKWKKLCSSQIKAPLWHDHWTWDSLNCFFCIAVRFLVEFWAFGCSVWAGEVYVREMHPTIKEWAGRNCVDGCAGNNRCCHSLSVTTCQKLQMTFTATVSYLNNVILKIRQWVFLCRQSLCGELECLNPHLQYVANKSSLSKWNTFFGQCFFLWDILGRLFSSVRARIRMWSVMPYSAGWLFCSVLTKKWEAECKCSVSV